MKTENFIQSFGARSEKFVRSYMPDPFVLVLLLTIVTFSSAIWFTPSTPDDLTSFWNKGFWELLSFGMQMVLIVVTGEAIAEASLVQKSLRRIASLPKSPHSAVMGLTFIAIVLGWLHWGLGLVVSSILGREIGKSLQNKKISIHYPILGTAAYMSMLLWHAGTTASAPLLINTPGHFLFQEIGLIPLSQTIFLPINLLACGVLAAFIPIVVWNLTPKTHVVTIDNFISVSKNFSHESIEKPKTFAEKLERSSITNITVGILAVYFLFKYFSSSGLNLNHNIVNFLFLAVGLLLHRDPISYSNAISRSIRGTAGIVLQFPFYGGIMGIIRDSGLGHQIAHIFINHANTQTLPFFAYLASIVTKLFIPSGGGEWAVEGPVMLAAAKSIGAPVGLTTMGIAYGNMVGNMFQPFWAIPLLSIMGLKARDIMGYCLVIFVFALPILGIALLIA